MLASKPDAIVILAFDETKSIVPELAVAGLGHVARSTSPTATRPTTARTSSQGTLEGAQGTIPGADPDQTFKDRAERLGRDRLTASR